MSDSQWARYEVFAQEQANKPFVNCGTVHAPDDEMALQNARDVFGRRPHVARLMLIHAERIYSRTAQQLASAASEDEQSSAERVYIAAQKLTQVGSHTVVGEVSATSFQEALRRAREKFGSSKNEIVWWVFAQGDAILSDPEDAAPMFEPALDKNFRDQDYYHVVTALREVKE